MNELPFCRDAFALGWNINDDHAQKSLVRGHVVLRDGGLEDAFIVGNGLCAFGGFLSVFLLASV